MDLIATLGSLILTLIGSLLAVASKTITNRRERKASAYERRVRVGKPAAGMEEPIGARESRKERREPMHPPLSIPVPPLVLPPSTQRGCAPELAGCVPTIAPGAAVLIAFAVLVLTFGCVTIVRYWQFIKTHGDLLFFASWLFLTMVAGMFVQTLASNYRKGKPLFSVRASQLIFPLLFSVVVFYPIWAIGSSAQQSYFAFYAAFLNGFFWETVVAAARLPASETAG